MCTSPAACARRRAASASEVATEAKRRCRAGVDPATTGTRRPRCGTWRTHGRVVSAISVAQPTLAELLFQPIKLGHYDLPHRIVMAPLTRSRIAPARQRADRAQRLLLRAPRLGRSHVSEATGIQSRERIEGWLRVTTAVHMEQRRYLRGLARRGSRKQGGSDRFRAEETTIKRVEQ